LIADIFGTFCLHFLFELNADFIEKIFHSSFGWKNKFLSRLKLTILESSSYFILLKRMKEKFEFHCNLRFKIYTISCWHQTYLCLTTTTTVRIKSAKLFFCKNLSLTWKSLWWWNVDNRLTEHVQSITTTTTTKTTTTTTTTTNQTCVWSCRFYTEIHWIDYYLPHLATYFC